MAEITGWFSDKYGHHIPIFDNESKEAASRRFYGSKHGKEVARLSSKSTGKSSSSNAKLVEYRNMSYEDLNKLESKLFSQQSSKLYEEGLNGSSNYQKLVRELNMNDKPTVLNKEEFNKQLKDNTPIYRGVRDIEGFNPNTGKYETKLTGKQIKDNLNYSDKTYIGNGNFGDGIYFTNDKGTAVKYADNKANNVTTAFIDKSKLKAVEYNKLEKMKEQFVDNYNKGKPFYEQITIGHIQSTFRDDSSFALYKGYNCIKVNITDKQGNTQTYYNVLDRGILCIQED